MSSSAQIVGGYGVLLSLPKLIEAFGNDNADAKFAPLGYPREDVIQWTQSKIPASMAIFLMGPVYLFIPPMEKVLTSVDEISALDESDFKEVQESLEALGKIF